MSETSPEKAAELIDRIESRRNAAAAKVDRCRHECALATLAAEEGQSGAAEAAKKARKALQEAELDFLELEGALSVAQQQHKAALQVRAKAEAESRWESVCEFGDRREVLASKIEETVGVLLGQYKELEKLSAEQFQAAPAKESGFAHSEFAGQHLVSALRQHMFKAGFTWACRFPWGPESIPTLSKRIKDGNQWILKLRRPPAGQHEGNSAQA